MASAFKNPNVTVGTTLTDLYVAPVLTESVMVSLNITNKNVTTTRNISLYIYDNSTATTRTILDNLDIPATDTFLYPYKISLEANDKLQIIVDVGTDVDAIATIMEKT